MMYKENNLNLLANPKKRIEEGCIVRTRDGEKRLMIKSPFLGKILISKNGYIKLDQYDKELYCCKIMMSKGEESVVRDQHKFDIMKVFDRVIITSTKSIEKYLSLSPEEEETELRVIWERGEG